MNSKQILLRDLKYSNEMKNLINHLKTFNGDSKSVYLSRIHFDKEHIETQLERIKEIES